MMRESFARGWHKTLISGIMGKVLTETGMDAFSGISPEQFILKKLEDHICLR